MSTFEKFIAVWRAQNVEALRRALGLKIRTNYDFPPIPIRSCDWSAIVEGSYCCPECRCAVGYGPTEAAAIADLMEQLEGEL